MPIRINFKRTHRYNVSAKDLSVIRILLLDGTCVEYTVTSSTTGKDALEYVSQRLDIEDTSVFGLKYEDWSGDHRWLFLNKSIKKQLDKHARQHAITLGVLLFIDNPQFIPDNQLRRFFYLQLRQDVATGALPVTLKLGIKLSAYSLQADFGDFVDVETTLNNWRERFSLIEGTVCGAFDLSSTDYVEDILWGYLHLQGVSQDNAIWYFLDEIRHIPQYGVRTFSGMTCRNEPAELGVSRNGITVTALDPGHHPTVGLKWEHIKDLTYSKKTFTIQMLKKNKSVQFLFDNSESARYLWQFCIQMHSSYIDYWTKVKSSPQQPPIHISEPPDILRGTELRYTTSESPLLNGSCPDGDSNCSLAPVALTQRNHLEVHPVQTISSTSTHHPESVIQHPDNTVTKTPNQNELVRRPFKIDPDLVKGSASVQHERTTGLETPSGRNHLEGLSNTAMLNAIQEGNGDSESGTLVGQWSLRSAADTLDSQMLNRGCVTCLPGREWLKPVGWFQPRSGVTSTRIEQVLSQLNSDLAKTSPKVRRENGKQSKSHGHSNHHRARHIRQTGKLELPVSERLHRIHSEHQNETVKYTGHANSKPRATSSYPARESHAVSSVSTRRDLIEKVPPSPSTLNSSDSSSEHGLVSSRASFSSSSSSGCSGAVKKAKIHRSHSDAKVTCSSSSSSTSSINTDMSSECDEEETKKFPFGLTAALCSAAQNITFKSNTKSMGPTQRQANRENSGRKLWTMQVGTSLRPLLAGLNQHHYRPQTEMKRQQAIADSIRQDHESAVINNAVGGRAVNKSSSQSKKILGNKKFHEFQRWLTEATQRLPSVLTHSVGGRGATLQISPPVSVPNQRYSGDLQGDKITDRTARESTMAINTMGTLQPVVLKTEQPGRMARSSSEACAHQLSSLLRSRSVDKENLDMFLKPPANFAHAIDQDNRTNGGSLTLIDGYGHNPSIRLHPASPTQTLYSQSGPSTSHDSGKSPFQWSSSLLSSESVNRLKNDDGLPAKSVTFQHQQPVNVPVTVGANQPMGLKRHGAIKVAPSWRLVPSPLNLADTNRLAVTPPRTIPIKQNFADPSAPQRQQISETRASEQIQTQGNDDNYNGKKINLQQLHWLNEREPITDGHSSAPPTTPNNRTHFVWDEFKLPDETKVSATQKASAYPNATSEWQQQVAVREGEPITLSRLLGKPTSKLESDVAVSPPTNNQQPKQNRDSPEENAQLLTCSITTTSSSEQSSSRRPLSNGPLHLLTNSDIHQLLSLTNIRETELAHRLLAEYRHALIQQQNLHTNSVSTPNLTASQELQMFSSSTAAEDIEDVEVEFVDEEIEPKSEKAGASKQSQPDDPSIMSHDHKKRNLHAPNPHLIITDTAHSHSSDKRLEHETRARHERNSLESPDYVNAAAFQDEEHRCEQRPHSITSSTDAESNGTFRVLSSTDTHPGSGADPGQSIASGDCIHQATEDWTNAAQEYWTQSHATGGNQAYRSKCTNLEQAESKQLKTTAQSPPDLCPIQSDSARTLVGNNNINRSPRSLIKRLANGEYENVETLTDRQVQVAQREQTKSTKPQSSADETAGLRPYTPESIDLTAGRTGHGSLSTLAYSPTSIEEGESPSYYTHSSSPNSSLESTSTNSSTPDLQDPASFRSSGNKTHARENYHIPSVHRTIEQENASPQSTTTSYTRINKQGRKIVGRELKNNGGIQRFRESSQIVRVCGCNCNCHDKKTLIKSSSLRMSPFKDAPSLTSFHKEPITMHRALSFDPPQGQASELSNTNDSYYFQKRHCRNMPLGRNQHKSGLKNVSLNNCISYSDEDINDISYCYSAHHLQRADDDNSITGSAAGSPSLSSMSSRSYSTSSLDLAAEDWPTYCPNCYCGPVNSIPISTFRNSHNGRRGSHESNFPNSQQRVTTAKLVSQASAVHRSLHRKRKSAQPGPSCMLTPGHANRSIECVHCNTCGSRLRVTDCRLIPPKEPHRYQHNRQLATYQTGVETKTCSHYSSSMKKDISPDRMTHCHHSHPHTHHDHHHHHQRPSSTKERSCEPRKPPMNFRRSNDSSEASVRTLETTSHSTKHHRDQRTTKSQNREYPAKPPRPKDLALFPRQFSHTQERGYLKMKMSPSLNIQSPVHNQTTFDESASSLPANATMANLGSPLRSCKPLDQSSPDNARYVVRSLRHSSDSIRSKNHTEADSQTERNFVQVDSGTTQKQNDTFQLYSVPPDRKHITLKGSAEVTSRPIVSNTSKAQTQCHALIGSPRTATPIQHTKSPLTSHSPSSPTMVYTSSMIFKPSPSTGSNKKIAAPVHPNKNAPLNFRDFLIKTNTMKLSSPTKESDTVIVRSGSLEPSELMLSRSRSGAIRSSQSNARNDGHTDGARGQRPASGMFQNVRPK